MKRKIIASLLLLFVISASGAITATCYIANTAATLSRLVTLHQISDLRQRLVISIQTVQTDLYTTTILHLTAAFHRTGNLETEGCAGRSARNGHAGGQARCDF